MSLNRCKPLRFSFAFEFRYFILLLLGLVLFLIAAAISNGWVLFLSALALAYAVLSLAIPLALLWNLEIELTGPEKLSAGEEIPLSLRLTLPSILQAFAGPMIICAQPAKNKRFNKAAAKNVLLAEFGTRNLLKLESPPMKRGIIALPDLEIETSYPFGIVWCKVRFRPQSSIIILPETVKIEGKFLYRLNSLSFVPGDSGSSNKGYESAGFRSIREYRRGDSRRLIHWGSSARVGKLMVKEREREGLPAFDLAFDLQADWQSENNFELGIIAAASLLKLGHTLGIHPELHILDQQETSKKRILDLDQGLIALSCLSYESAKPGGGKAEPNSMQIERLSDSRPDAGLNKQKAVLLIRPKEAANGFAFLSREISRNTCFTLYFESESTDSLTRNRNDTYKGIDSETGRHRDNDGSRCEGRKTVTTGQGERSLAEKHVESGNYSTATRIQPGAEQFLIISKRSDLECL